MVSFIRIGMCSEKIFASEADDPHVLCASEQAGRVACNTERLSDFSRVT